MTNYMLKAHTAIGQVQKSIILRVYDFFPPADMHIIK